ncbi:MAG TPA: aldo/keto reductase [Candidatus Deferrimicrobiaceae bacterium]|nr:aldo/keto reductase [Candidatus Deferrimicrobiaceae bacterium]
MRYKLLGRSGLRVSELCLGAMTFGEEWGWGASKEESRRIFEAFAEAGGNFIDTANYYTAGTSEMFVGEFIASERRRFVVATKYTLNMRPDDPNAGGNHRKNMTQSLEESLARLRTDYVDLYWVHAWDPMTPVEEMMRALDDLVRAGKILYVGISDAPAWAVSRANTLADLMGWTPFVGLQIPYSLIERTPERELLPMARALDIAVTPWGILGGGVLTGKYKTGKPRPKDARYGSQEEWGNIYVTERNLSIAEEVDRVSKEIGKTASQVAVAWVRQQPHGVVIPILGATKLAQLKDNLGCLELSLSGDHLRRLDEASRIDLGFPLAFLDQVRRIVYGNTFPLIDDHRGA